MNIKSIILNCLQSLGEWSRSYQCWLHPWRSKLQWWLQLWSGLCQTLVWVWAAGRSSADLHAQRWARWAAPTASLSPLNAAGCRAWCHRSLWYTRKKKKGKISLKFFICVWKKHIAENRPMPRPRPMPIIHCKNSLFNLQFQVIHNEYIILNHRYTPVNKQQLWVYISIKCYA